MEFTPSQKFKSNPPREVKVQSEVKFFDFPYSRKLSWISKSFEELKKYKFFKTEYWKINLAYWKINLALHVWEARFNFKQYGLWWINNRKQKINFAFISILYSREARFKPDLSGISENFGGFAPIIQFK